MANRSLHATPIHPILLHVLSRPKTRHPSHAPPLAPDPDHDGPLLILRLHLARTETQRVQLGRGLLLLRPHRQGDRSRPSQDWPPQAGRRRPGRHVDASHRGQGQL